MGKRLFSAFAMILAAAVGIAPAILAIYFYPLGFKASFAFFLYVILLMMTFIALSLISLGHLIAAAWDPPARGKLDFTDKRMERDRYEQ